MGAPLGNTYYKYRKKHGRERIFSSADELLEQCNAYFKWCDDNPMFKSEIVKYKDHAELMNVPILRPYTKQGLSDFCQVSQYKTISNYKERGEDFLQVITYVEGVIYNQKFSGAAGNLLNANIIARDLGLSDKQDLTTGGEKINDNKITKVEIIKTRRNEDTGGS